MTIDNLKNKLKELHANLESTGQVDSELKEQLQSLDDDVQQLLNTEPENPSIATSLAAQAQALSAKFAAQHPQMEPALRELAALLEGIGL
jgi:hypothetical protein